MIWAVAWPSLAFAHSDGSLTSQNAWSAWTFTGDVVAASLLIATVYAIGSARRFRVAEALAWWRHAAFIAGLATISLALQSPVDAVAERLFLMHQVQHLLLRVIAPMLIALSWPQGILVAGLPPTLRRAWLAPIAGSSLVRAIFRTIGHPVAVTAIFVGSLYFWQVPRFHNIALLSEPVHYGMHVSMLVAGVLFWSRVFDHRAAPQGLRYGVRLMMLWLVILANIVIGAYTTFKSTVLYNAYDVQGRLFGYAPLADEQLGGVVIWIPGSMMCVVAVLIVIHIWGRHEARIEDKRARWLKSTGETHPHPNTISAFIVRQRPKNRALALGFGAFVIVVFAMAILIGVLRQW
jgi:putative membrane protein